MTTRPVSSLGPIIRAGFSDPEQAATLLADPALSFLGPADGEVFSTFTRAADPDLALLSVQEIAHNQTDDQFARIFGTDEVFRQRFIAVLGASEALGSHFRRHSDQWKALAADCDQPPTRDQLIAEFTQAVLGAGDWSQGSIALRVIYRSRLAQTAARDLVGAAPYEQVTGELADLADAVLESSLALARTELTDEDAPCRLAVIAMGKCGGRELNYISDVDVIFVAEPIEGADETAALVTATKLAQGIMRAANEATEEGTIWEVDAALRPEGKAGALVRTLASHVGYYDRWAQTWEFQALLKARFAAGDAELGAAYTDALLPKVWSAAARPDFVADVQAMRRRVEENIGKNAERELKLGHGGLRDVEFSVQLLQLVHGRADVMLRSPNTIEALQAMSLWGYVGREDAATLAAAYRFLRSVEHRLQLRQLRRTHVLPDDDESLRFLGRAMGYRREPGAELLAELHKHRVAVRRLHEKLFYRPLLNAVARLDPGDARLTRDAASERLQALGYADPDGALRHLEALTSGVSRRAAIQRTLLPVLLGWFADGPNPDAGLLAFRKVSDALGSTHWYLRLLRDESETAERLAHILASSRYATELLLKAPNGVAVLGDEQALTARSGVEIEHEITSILDRTESADAAMELIMATRRRELLRICASDITGRMDVHEVGAAITTLTDVTLQSVLEIVRRDVASTMGLDDPDDLPTAFSVIGLGRLGGREAGYSSDADVMFVHEPTEGSDEQEATRVATAIANGMKARLSPSANDVGLEIDSDLRPEGRSGPPVRTLASYAKYYERWSSPWEAQAMLRARPVAGDVDLSNRFMQLIDPLRWPASGISEADLREMRRLKARMESERLPRGVDPAMHVKLGRGGLSDVEWVAQLFSLQHAHQYSQLQSTNTLTVLDAATDAGLCSEEDCVSLKDAWSMASQIRNAVFLVSGRANDQLPTEHTVLAGVAFLMGYSPTGGAALTDDYLRLTRHSRAVTERLFYGWEPVIESPI